MKPITKMTAGLVALALQFGLVAGAHAGGPALLELPIEGVTTENSEQCIKLFEEKIGGVRPSWGDFYSRNVKSIKDGSTNSIQLQLIRKHTSLREIEKALKGGPFSIKRDQLEYFGIVRLRIGQSADHQKIVDALATLSEKELSTEIEKDKDGSLLITVSDPTNVTRPLFTHQRLTSHLSDSKIKLIEISWGPFHCRAPYGARPAAPEVAQK